MFKALVKSRMAALLSSVLRSSRFKKKKSPAFKLLIVIFAIYIIGCFFFMFGWMFSSFCKPLVEYGLAWLYFGLAAMMATVLSFISSVFTAQQQLFSAKDNDLLLSMPIPAAYILGSRMLLLYVLNLLMEILVLAPVGVVYCIHYTPSVVGVILFVVCSLALPFIPMTLSCIFGWLLALTLDRVRNKSLITTVFSLAFLAAYFYLYSNMNQYINEMIQNGAAIAEAVRNSIYPAYAFGAAIADGNMVQFAGFLICCFVPFIIIYVILSLGFIRITTSRRGAAKIKYREQTLKVGSVSSALLKKELRHFGSNGMYIMNAGIGSVFTLAGAVALIIYRDLPQTIIVQIPEIAGYLGPAAAGALCMLAATDIISAPSISLEGKNLWIAQSLPVSGGTILMAKANMHIVVALPPVILASLAVLFVISPAPLMAIGILILPAIMTVFCALLGVTVNLHFPKFDFINEVVAIKQSMSTIVSMFSSMGAVFIPGALYIWLLADIVPGDIFILLYSAVLAAACFIMFRYIKTGGARRFAELG